MSRDKYVSPLSERYASKEMQYIFSPDMKFRTWRKLWIALAETKNPPGSERDSGGRGLTVESGRIHPVSSEAAHAAEAAASVDKGGKGHRLGLAAEGEGVGVAFRQLRATDDYAVVVLFGGVFHEDVPVCVGEGDDPAGDGGSGQKDAALSGGASEILRHAAVSGSNDGPSGDGGGAVIIQSGVPVVGGAADIDGPAGHVQIAVGVDAVAGSIDADGSAGDVDGAGRASGGVSGLLTVKAAFRHGRKVGGRFSGSIGGRSRRRVRIRRPVLTGGRGGPAAVRDILTGRRGWGRAAVCPVLIGRGSGRVLSKTFLM